MAEEAAAAPGDVQADDTAPAPSPEATGPDTEQAPDPEPNIAFSLVDDTTEAAGATGEGDTEGSTVPSYRLREEAEKRRAAESQLQQTQQMNAVLQNQAYQTSTASKAPQAGETEEERLRKSFGTEEEGGPAAYDAVKNVSQYEARQLMEQAKNELRVEMRGEIQRGVGGVTASITTSQELSNMRSQGLIDASAETEIGRRMGQVISQNASWGEPQNQRFLLNEVYVGMLKAGEIRPGVVPPAPATPSGNGNSPLQPGSGGQRLTAHQKQESLDAELRQMQTASPKRLGSLTIEQLRELHKNAIGEGEVPQQASTGPVAYVHRR